MTISRRQHPFSSCPDLFRASTRFRLSRTSGLARIAGTSPAMTGERCHQCQGARYVRTAARTPVGGNPGANAAPRDRESDRAVARQAGCGRDPGRESALLCDAAPPRDRRRGHPRDPARSHRGTARAAGRRAAAGDRGVSALGGARLRPGMRNPRRRPRRILFRRDPALGPSRRRNIARADRGRDRRTALAEIDALARLGAALGAALDLDHLPL